MGSSISKIYDLHETYVAFCEKINEEPLDVRENFLKHEEFLLKKHGYIKDGCWFKKINEK